jgi:hypothetical protein
MLLFAALCDAESAEPVACADHSGGTQETARCSAVGQTVLRAARSLCRGVSTHRRLAACTVNELRIFSLCYGRLCYIVAAPAGSPGGGSAFAAVALLSDLSARWELAAVQRAGSGGSPIEDVALAHRLVHFASTSVDGDAPFASADLLATAGTPPAWMASSSPAHTPAHTPAHAPVHAPVHRAGEGTRVGEGASPPAAPPSSPVESLASAELRSQLAAARQTAAELRASRQSDVLQLSEKV